jgi:plastocyanin
VLGPIVRRVPVAVAGIAGALAVTLGGCAVSGTHVHVSGTGAAVAAVPSATATARPAADGVQQVLIDATDDSHFKPDVVLAHPGKLRITLTNASLYPQDLSIPTLGVHSATVFAGNSATITFTIPAAGSYPFVCTFLQHQGMTGELVVS